MLPAMQIFVEAFRNKIKLTALLQAESEEFMKASRILGTLHTKCIRYETDIMNPLLTKKIQGLLTEAEKPIYREIKNTFRQYKEERSNYQLTEYSQIRTKYNELNSELSYWYNIYENGTNTATKLRREFMMCCPAESCRGFLSTSYKCGICDKYTCSECLEVLGLISDTATLDALKEAHTCKAENIESAKMIKKETRPCPKCGARIFKIDGCDQMWCTVDGCSTAFSWNTGHVVTGKVHNPHYYEWLRRNGNGEAPREVGDIPCGGIPNPDTFMRQIINNPVLLTEEKNHIFEIHRNIVDLEARLQQFPARPDALMNKDINVRYLMNTITEEVWKQKLEHKEAAFNRKKEIGQLLQTFVTASADILQTMVGQVQDRTKSPNEVANFIREVALSTLESLRSYTNESYINMAKARRMAVPQINERWQWLGIRALYKTDTSHAMNTVEETDQPPPLAMDILDEFIRGEDTDEELNPV
jgi:hypothetical protein